MPVRINQDLDEGLSGDPRALHLAITRGQIRKRIEGQGGYPAWWKANAMGKEMVPTMAAQTIIKFAYGITKRPDPWTIKALSEVAGYELFFLPKGTVVPGAIKFE